MSYNPVVHFVAHIVPALLIGSFSSWILCPLNISPSFFEHCFTFWHHKIVQAHLIFSLPGFLWPERYGYSPGVSDACVLVAVLVQKNKILERKNKIGNSPYILVICRALLLFPVLWLEMQSSQSFAVSTLCIVLEFSRPSCQNQERTEEKIKHMTFTSLHNFMGIIIQVLISVPSLPALVSFSQFLGCYFMYSVYGFQLS